MKKNEKIKKNKAVKLNKIHTVWYSLIVIFMSFSLLGTCYLVLGTKTHAQQELIEQAFKPAREYEGIIDLGNTKDAVGNEVFREGTIVNTNIKRCQKDGKGVDVSGTDKEKEAQCIFLGGTWTPRTASKAPLIVRITKFLLRMTIVLSITMVLYSGVMYIVEASKGAEVKETTNNLMYIIGGVLLALMSLGLINLITSLSISSLGVTVGG